MKRSTFLFSATMVMLLVSCLISSPAWAVTIVVRALGTAGTEQISLTVNNTTVQTWTLTTSMANYTATTSLSGECTVAFINDADGRDVQVTILLWTALLFRQKPRQLIQAPGRITTAAAHIANGCIAAAILTSVASEAVINYLFIQHRLVWQRKRTALVHST